MPNLPAHLHLALQAQARLCSPLLERHLGPYLLGSTAPDIRAMTRGRRDNTHFGPLSVERIGVGPETLLRLYPHLADPARVGDATRAFVAGYISHLVADEAWIIHVYRPYFGDRTLLPNDRQANLWDRAVQLDLDRRAWDEIGDLAWLRDRLARAEEGVEVDFLDPDLLARWRERVTDFARHEFSWERLRFMARRLFGEGDAETLELVEAFLGDVPGTMGRIYRLVPRPTVDAFWETALAEFLRIGGGYLGLKSCPGARPG